MTSLDLLSAVLSHDNEEVASPVFIFGMLKETSAQGLSYLLSCLTGVQLFLKR